VDDTDYFPISARRFFAHMGICCLWIFGNNVEDRLGHVKYLILFMWCFGSLNAVVLSQNSGIPSLGASGAIAGVMGAYILRHELRF